MGKYQSFEELKNARLKAYNGMREGDVLGFLDQHTGFYPDPAHFIYELLQNAEDMEATEVKFNLFQINSYLSITGRSVISIWMILMLLPIKIKVPRLTTLHKLENLVWDLRRYISIQIRPKFIQVNLISE